MSFFLFFLLLILVTPVVIYFAIRLKELYQDKHPPTYLAQRPPKDSYKFIKLNKGERPRTRKWLKQMGTLGLRFKDKKIQQIIFVHGTLVGNDPYDIIRLFEELIPFIPPSIKKNIGDWLRKKTRFLNALILRDAGHFSDDYIRLLREVFPQDIGISNFIWSSGNHHMARIRGTLKLTNTLINLNIKNHDRILLIGHSHGGQLFSLLSLMIGDPNFQKKILTMLPDPEDAFSYEQKFRQLKEVNLDFVTMGTPPRYPWNLNSKRRLINLINHRGEVPLAGRTSGFIFTRDGDYLQQYGVNGSDNYSTIGPDRKKNKELEEMLGIGASIPNWLKEVRKRKRVPEFGLTLLINYKDQSIFPNLIRSFFGHGIYTKKRMMLFTFSQIKKRFYP